MDAEKVIECASCGLAILTPDGGLRCSTDFSLAKLKCNEFISGKPRILEFGQATTSKIKIRKKTSSRRKRI